MDTLQHSYVHTFILGLIVNLDNKIMSMFAPTFPKKLNNPYKVCVFLINSFQCSEFSTNINVFLSSWEYKPDKENDQQFQLKLFIHGISSETFGQDKQRIMYEHNDDSRISDCMLHQSIKRLKQCTHLGVCIYVMCIYVIYGFSSSFWSCLFPDATKSSLPHRQELPRQHLSRIIMKKILHFLRERRSVSARPAGLTSTHSHLLSRWP